jgi:hypothetical protein
MKRALPYLAVFLLGALVAVLVDRLLLSSETEESSSTPRREVAAPEPALDADGGSTVRISVLRPPPDAIKALQRADGGPVSVATTAEAAPPAASPDAGAAPAAPGPTRISASEAAKPDSGYGAPWVTITPVPQVTRSPTSTVRGIVRWAGEIPKYTPGRADNCDVTLPRNRISADRLVQDALVTLGNGFAPSKPTARAPAIVSKGCRFEPFVQVAGLGDLTVTDDDTRVQDLQGSYGGQRVFIHQLSGPGQTFTVPLGRAGLYELADQSLGRAYVFVDYATRAVVTGADGTFEISGLDSAAPTEITAQTFDPKSKISEKFGGRPGFDYYVEIRLQ